MEQGYRKDNEHQFNPVPPVFWKEELKEGLKDQIRTLVRMVNLMPPKNEAELIGTALPNLHIFTHNFIESLLTQQEARLKREFEKKGYQEGYSDREKRIPAKYHIPPSTN